MLAEQNLGGALIISQHNFAWLTAGGANGVDMSREAGSGALLVTRDGKRFVLANRIEMPRLLDEELSGAEFEPIEFPWEEEKASPTLLVTRALKLLGNSEALGADVNLGVEALPIDGAVASCRYELTSSEIERFRSLGGHAALAVANLARSLEPGETEIEVAHRLAHALAAYDIRAVVNLVAADERIGQYRHPVPTHRRWEKTLMMVVCARRGGLTASLTRLVCNGRIPEELQRRTLAVARVNSQLLSRTQPGATGSDLYKVAARAYAAEGFEGEQHLHHQGGACGYRTRDWVAHPASAEVVRPQQAFAWNPSITGTKTEETCVVSADGVEILTASPAWPTISVSIGKREYTSPGVLSL